jgi:hypothetical protein
LASAKHAALRHAALERRRPEDRQRLELRFLGLGLVLVVAVRAQQRALGQRHARALRPQRVDEALRHEQRASARPERLGALRRDRTRAPRALRVQVLRLAHPEQQHAVRRPLERVGRARLAQLGLEALRRDLGQLDPGRELGLLALEGQQHEQIGVRDAVSELLEGQFHARSVPAARVTIKDVFPARSWPRYIPMYFGPPPPSGTTHSMLP